MKRTDDNEQGAVLLIVAILLVVFCTIAAFAVDFGYWATVRRQLQSAADAAALAGCQELSHGATDDEVWAVVTDYAGRNFSNPVEITRASVVAPAPGGLSDIGTDFVKVTVREQASSFFARIMGMDSKQVSAQSIARLGYLMGGRGPMPWGLPILRVNNMDATMGGETIDLAPGADDYWVGSFSAGLSGPITLSASNQQDYVELFEGLVGVGSLPSAGRISDIELNRTTFTSGVNSTCSMKVTLASPLAPGGKVEASFGKGKVTLTPSSVTTNTYVGDIGVGTTADPYEKLQLSISVAEGASSQTASCGLLLRRANYILLDVDVFPNFVRPGESATIKVRTLDFTYGEQYQLKVEGGAGTTGNYLALDFASLDHSACGMVGSDPAHSGGGDYREYIIGVPGLIVHVDDYVTSLPGDKLGPTKQGIDGRLLGENIRTFEQWELDGKPDTKQLVIIPICERTEDPNGRTVMRIVSFATFFLEQTTSSGGNVAVVGRFVEWTTAAWVVVDDPPGPLSTRAVHLDSEGLDF